MPPVISEENKTLILSEIYFCRYMGCENVLRAYNIDKGVCQIRRVISLIKTKRDTPTAEERLRFGKALVELEKYVLNYNKEIHFRSLKKKDLNELFLDECYDYTSLTQEKVAEFFKHGADVNYKDEQGLKPFHYAAKSDYVDLNAEFIKRGASVNEQYAKNSAETIWTVNHSCDYNKLKLFIEGGAKVNAKDSRGNTVLHNLVELSNVENVKFLVKKGADVHARNADGQTPLFLAARNACTDNIKFFIEKGCDVNLVDKRGNTPLLLAASVNSAETVEYLIQKGASMSARNYEGKHLNDLMSGCEIQNLLTISRISNTIEPKRSASMLSLNLDSAKMQKTKELIISKLKSGAKQLNYHKDGSSSLEFDNGVYIYKYTAKDQSGVNVYSTDEQVINFLYAKYKGMNQNKQMSTFEFILNSLF